MVELSISYLDQTLMTTFRMDLHSFSMLIESNTPNTGYLQMNGAVSKVNKKWCVFSKPCTKLTLHCNHRSGHLKTEHTERLFLLRRHLGNWPSSPAVSTSERTVGSAWETWTVAAADGVRFARVRWEINFLLTFETAPFICKHTVFSRNTQISHFTNIRPVGAELFHANGWTVDKTDEANSRFS